MVRRKRKRGQTWSIDLIIGVVVFMLVIVILYALLSTDPDEEHVLRQEADIVYSRLDAETSDTEISHIVEGQRIETTKIKELYSMNYDELKGALGTRGEFCIVIVDDDNRIIPVEEEGVTYLSGGNPDHGLIISKDSGILCGDTR